MAISGYVQVVRDMAPTMLRSIYFTAVGTSNISSAWKCGSGFARTNVLQVVSRVQILRSSLFRAWKLLLHSERGRSDCMYNELYRKPQIAIQRYTGYIMSAEETLPVKNGWAVKCLLRGSRSSGTAPTNDCCPHKLGIRT